MITTAIVLPRPILSAFRASRYFPLPRSGECRERSGSRQRREKWEKARGPGGSLVEKKWVAGMDGGWAGIGSNASSCSLDIPANECLDELREPRGEPARSVKRETTFDQIPRPPEKKLHYDGSVTVGLRERFSPGDGPRRAPPGPELSPDRGKPRQPGTMKEKSRFQLPMSHFVSSDRQILFNFSILSFSPFFPDTARHLSSLRSKVDRSIMAASSLTLRARTYSNRIYSVRSDLSERKKHKIRDRIYPRD